MARTFFGYDVGNDALSDDGQTSAAGQDQPMQSANRAEKALIELYKATVGWLPSQATARTYRVHNAPGDYYRFSTQTLREVFLHGMVNKQIVEILDPPRLVCKGRYTPESSNGPF